jgi:tyrosyl-DNA phosphodiesterase 1
MIIAMFTDDVSLSEPEEDDDIVFLGNGTAQKGPVVGWAYVGSHNFTPSAWGNLSGSAFTPILNVRLFTSGHQPEG